jgi:SAM-dependent methyltransferase
MLFKERLTGHSGGKILDVATECGWFIDKLKDAFREIDEVIGIDITDQDFDKARERLKKDPVNFMIMNGANLEFADELFDTVAMAFGMHHLNDIPSVLSEMKRVLKPGGNFVLRENLRDVTDEKQKTDLLQHDWYARIDRLRGRPHYPSLTKQEIIEHVEGLGLRRYETDKYLCDDCPRSKGETIEKEIIEMDEHLAKVKGNPLYDELVKERDTIVKRLRTVGICCQAGLDIVGIK